MDQALYSFDDAAAARAFAERVRALGVPDDGVTLHTDKASGAPGDPHVGVVDELVTGGVVGNLLDLSQGVFDWPDAGEDREAWADAVRAGGAVVSVRSDDAEEQRRVDELAVSAGRRRHTGWRPGRTTAA